ncbi:MAG: hypothetical protein ACJ788_13635 [Ktedonobacteraceae bacterium]
MSEERHTRPMQTYDVALWLSWPSLFPAHVGCVEASGSYAAVVSLMETCGVEKVAYAAARLVTHAHIDRWQLLYIPLAFRQKTRRG